MEIDVYLFGVSVDPEVMTIDLIVKADDEAARIPMAKFLRSTVIHTPEYPKYDIKLVFTEIVDEK